MSQYSQQKNAYSGIILAAGTGSRMGRVKQILDYEEKPMLQHVIDSAKQSRLSKLIVVLGYQARKIRGLLDLSGTETLVNQFYETGQGGSIRIGLSVVPDHHQAALFLLGDQPLITPDLIDAILQRYESTQAPIVIPRYRGERGNPVLIQRTLFGRLYKLSGDSGGRELFNEFKDQIAYLETDNNAVLRDIDTLADYHQLIGNIKLT